VKHLKLACRTLPPYELSVPNELLVQEATIAGLANSSQVAIGICMRARRGVESRQIYRTDRTDNNQRSARLKSSDKKHRYKLSLPKP
jgi:hypothetical protein